MLKIQKCKRHGVCNSCAKQLSEGTEVWEIKTSVTGQGWTTIMLCQDCLLLLNASLSIKIYREFSD